MVHWLRISLPTQFFPGSSAGKESTSNIGGPSSTPGSGRSPGEGIGYSPQYSWASLVTQPIKNPPAMRETWIWFLGWEVSWPEELHEPYSPWGSQSWTQWSNFPFHFSNAGDLGSNPVCMCVQSLSHFQLCATPSTVILLSLLREPRSYMQPHN